MLSCTYLAHHELESVLIIIIIIITAKQSLLCNNAAAAAAAQQHHVQHCPVQAENGSVMLQVLQIASNASLMVQCISKAVSAIKVFMNSKLVLKHMGWWL